MGRLLRVIVGQAAEISDKQHEGKAPEDAGTPGLGRGLSALKLMRHTNLTFLGEKVRWTKACKWHALVSSPSDVDSGAYLPCQPCPNTPSRPSPFTQFVLNIACVEFCEFLIWLDVLPIEDASRHDTCPTLNSIGTYGVFIFGFVNWMWIIALWAYYSSDNGRDKARFQLWVVLGIITSMGYILKIILGDHFQLSVDFWDYTERWSYNASMRVVTCSFHDGEKYAHLHWRFNMSPQAWLPHGYSWFTVGLVPLFAYKPHDLAAVLSTYGALTYVVPKIFLPVEETMSMY